MKSIRHSIFRILVLVIILGLGGCVWLRLLEVKHQLAEFDEHFRVEVAADKYFVLHLLQPVLLSEDFVYLTKLNPSRVTTLPRGYRWFLDFRKDPAPSRVQGEKNLVFAMSFTPNHKLAAFHFSPLFLEMAPPAFLEASIRSLGLGKVDQGKQQLKVDPEDLPKLAEKLPSQKAILDVLGTPAEQFTQDDLTVLVYRFKAEAAPVEPEYEKRRMAEAKLYFDPAKDELVRLAGRFVGLKLAIDYRKLTQKSEKAIDTAAREN